MNRTHRRSSLFPLILLSYSLACSGPQAIPTVSFGRGIDHASQKQALISPVDLFAEPAMKTHLHPSNIFSYDAPAGWTAVDLPHAVQISSPTSIVLSISVIDGGYKLSTSSFIKLAANTENSLYMNRDQYRVVAQREDRANRFVFIEKTYLQDDEHWISLSIYRQVGQLMYVVEMNGDGTEITSSPSYEELFFAFNESIRPHPQVDLTSAAYLDLWTFAPADHRFSMEIPLGWEWSASKPSDNIEKTQFRSPDGNAVIDNVFGTYDEFIALDFAADYALKLIGASYANGVDDIMVTSEIILGDGESEKITWVSRSGGYAGVAYFEVRNRLEMRVLSFSWNRLFDDIYATVMENAAATYQLHPAIE